MTHALSEKSWTVALRSPTAEKLEISVYDVIGQSFFGDSVSAKDVLTKLSAAPKATEITLRINSNGGVVDDAKAMINLLAQRKAQGAKVNAFVDGIAASSASYLTTVADHVTVASNAFVMFHQARTGRMGNAKDFADTSEMLNRVNEQLAEGYAAASERRAKGKTKAEFLAAMANGDTYLDADQAIAWGLADAKSEPLKVVAALADISGLLGAPDALRAAAYVAQPTIAAAAKFTVGARVKSLVEHMPGMKGATGDVEIAREGTPPYYGIKFDGTSEVHKWLAEDEIADAKGAPKKPMKMSASAEGRLSENQTTPDPVVQDEPKPSPTTGKEASIMAFPKNVLTILALDESASEEAVVAAVNKLKTSASVGGQIEQQLGVQGAAAIGAVRALQEEREKNKELFGEVAKLKIVNARREFDSLIEKGKNVSKNLTGKGVSDYTSKFEAAAKLAESEPEKGAEEASAVCESLRGYLAIAPRYSIEARQPSFDNIDGSSITHDGKKFEELKPMAQKALKDSNPEKYSAMREDAQARGAI